MIVTPAAEALWQYSLRLYANPAVSAACLRLQDESGADVNMIFLLLFAATRGLQLSEPEVKRLERDSTKWREGVIEPLRRVRRLVKHDGLGMDCDMYRQVKATELLAERRLQFALAAALAGLPAAKPNGSPLDAARVNLQAYVPLRSAPADDVAILLSAFAADLSSVRNVSP